MIDDEVICGFGRLGTMFGCEKLGFRPHSLSIAKAMSSAYLPIAGVMIPETMYQALLTESKKIGVFGHGFTYGGHPVSAAVALKAIEIYQRDRIVEQAAARAPQFQARLAALRRPSAGRRGARARPDRRRRTRRRQEDQAVIRRRARGRRPRGGVRRSRGPDRALGARRRDHAVPAADHQRGGNRRAVRPARRARSTARSIGSRANVSRRGEDLPQSK